MFSGLWGYYFRMEIVSEHSDRDIAMVRAEKRINIGVRELTANLMRVTRGAGKPDEIPSHLNSLIVAIAAYEQVTGDSVPSEIFANELRVQGRTNSRYDDIGRAEYKMIKGALQIAASVLMRQGTQQSAGENELHRGIQMRRKAILDLD